MLFKVHDGFWFLFTWSYALTNSSNQIFLNCQMKFSFILGYSTWFYFWTFYRQKAANLDISNEILLEKLFFNQNIDDISLLFDCMMVWFYQRTVVCVIMVRFMIDRWPVKYLVVQNESVYVVGGEWICHLVSKKNVIDRKTRMLTKWSKWLIITND